jgi:uncharacterized protein DUF4412
MRTRQLPVLLLPLALATPWRAVAQVFEGVVKQRVITVLPSGVEALLGGPGQDPSKLFDIPLNKLTELDTSKLRVHNVTISVKGNRMRTDGAATGGPFRGGYTIVQADQGVSMMVMPSSKRIVVVTPEDAKSMAQRARQAAGADTARADQPQSTDLGARTINGFAARGVRVSTPTGSAIVWASSELGPSFARFRDVQAGLRAMAPADVIAMLNAADAIGYPILLQHVIRVPRSRGGGEGYIYTITEVTGIDRAPVSDELFTLPADYTQVTMTQMMSRPRSP